MYSNSIIILRCAFFDWDMFLNSSALHRSILLFHLSSSLRASLIHVGVFIVVTWLLLAWLFFLDLLIVIVCATGRRHVFTFSIFLVASFLVSQTRWLTQSACSQLHLPFDASSRRTSDLSRLFYAFHSNLILRFLGVFLLQVFRLLFLPRASLSLIGQCAWPACSLWSFPLGALEGLELDKAGGFLEGTGSAIGAILFTVCGEIGDHRGLRVLVVFVVLPPVVTRFCRPTFGAGFGWIGDRVAPTRRVSGVDRESSTWASFGIWALQIGFILFEFLFDWWLILFILDDIQVFEMTFVVLLFELNVVFEVLQVFVFTLRHSGAWSKLMILCLFDGPLTNRIRHSSFIGLGVVYNLVVLFLLKVLLIAGVWIYNWSFF